MFRPSMASSFAMSRLLQEIVLPALGARIVQVMDDDHRQLRA
jgi:hypothetical protein